MILWFEANLIIHCWQAVTISQETFYFYKILVGRRKKIDFIFEYFHFSRFMEGNDWVIITPSPLNDPFLP